MMEPLPVTGQTNLETIFSLDLEHEKTNFKMTHNDAVRSEQTESPHPVVADDIDDESCSSIYFPPCSELDFDIPDNFATLDFDIEFTYPISTSCPDFKFLNPDMFIYTTLPSLEDTAETNNIPDGNSLEEAMINYEDVSLYLKSEQEFSSGLDDLKEMECIDQQLLFRTVQIPEETQKRKSFTLVLDLDETLIHSTMKHCDNADFMFRFILNMTYRTVYVRQRPYLQMFLEKVVHIFDVVIFTAGKSIYANPILDTLDPTGNLITRRLYRESCIFSDGKCTKDLSILGVDLAKVAIIDNTPQVFQLQVNNGIPIKSWFDDPSDDALISLIPFLESLVHVDDVCPIIAERFSNKECSSIISSICRSPIAGIDHSYSDDLFLR